jgi:putative ABC transport system substrate-binding protein
MWHIKRKHLKKLIFLFALILGIPSLSYLQEKKLPVIGISQIVQHPALDSALKGMLQILREQGYEKGKTLIVHYENAQGNVVTATQIATKLLSEPLDIAVGISTPSAQTLYFAALKQDKRPPIVFSVVSDPVGSKLGSEKDYPITGVTDAVQLKETLGVILKLMPHLKNLGVMYNPAEVNSNSTVTKLKAQLQAKGITLREATVNKTNDVMQAAKSLVGKVEAIYIPQDNTVVAAIESVSSAVTLPIFCSDPLLVKNGVLAGIGFDYSEIGKETGRIVARILQGESAAQIPFCTPKNLQAVINAPAAKRYGLTIPLAIDNVKIMLNN